MSLVTCSSCVAEQFEDGFGAKRKVNRVWDQVGDKCAVPQTRRDVQRTLEFVEGLQREHPDIDWREFLDKAQRSERRLKAWEARYPEEQIRVRGFLRLCDEDSAWISRAAKRHLIDTCLRTAKATLSRIGEVQVQIDTTDPVAVKRLKGRQTRLDQTRADILLGIERIEIAVKKLDTRGLLKGPAFYNILKDTVSQAVQAHLRVQAYEAGKDQVDEHKMAQAARLAAQSMSAEEEEAADSASKALGQPEADGEPKGAVETFLALPDEIRIIKARKTPAAQQKETDRAKALLEKYGGSLDLWFWDATSLEAQIAEAAARNGSGIRITKRGRKGDSQPKTATTK